MKYPEPVQLEGKDLPWVESADHLGHTLSQLNNMGKDCQRARGTFIRTTIEVREQLSFALPRQIMQAIQLLCTDAYGSMLWDLSSDEAEKYFKCWNTCVKLTYDFPRTTFIYLVRDSWQLTLQVPGTRSYLGTQDFLGTCCVELP